MIRIMQTRLVNSFELQQYYIARAIMYTADARFLVILQDTSPLSFAVIKALGRSTVVFLRG